MDVVSEYRAWVEIAEDLLSDPSPQFPVLRVLNQLVSTFETVGSWNWEDPDGSFGAEFSHPRSGWPGDAEIEAWLNGGRDSHPLVRWFRATGDPRPMSLGRVPSAMVAPGALELARDLAPHGETRQLSIPFHLGPGYQAYVFGKGGADFSDDAIELARLIGPLLTLVWRHKSELQRCPATGTAHEAVAHAGLTGRELAVLRLLADGLTAAAIGHRLGISVRTVHSHLAHLYRKLEVADRMRAVLIAQDAGLLDEGVRPH